MYLRSSGRKLIIETAWMGWAGIWRVITMRSTSRNASLSGKKNPIVIRYCAAQLCYDDWRNARNESQLQDKYEGITQDWTGDSCECSILCGHLCARIIISTRSKSLRETFRPCIAYSIIGKVPLPILYFTYVAVTVCRSAAGKRIKIRFLGNNWHGIQQADRRGWPRTGKAAWWSGSSSR